MTVDNYIFAAFYFRNSVEGKTDGLEDRKNQVHKQSRKQTGPDKGHRKEIADFGSKEVGVDMGDKGLVVAPSRFFEADFFTLDDVVKLLLFFLDLFVKFFFKRLYLFNDILQVFHSNFRLKLFGLRGTTTLP